MCCAILFPAGPEAVLRQPLEDMKAWVSGGAWVQPGEGCTWTPLAHNPSSYMTRCMFYIQVFYFSRVSWLRRPSWVPYPLPYPDQRLQPAQNFWVYSEFLSFFVLYSRILADFLSLLGKWVKLIKFEAENEFFCTWKVEKPQSTTSTP